MLEQLQGVQPQFGLRDLEMAAQDRGAFVLDEEEGAVGVVLCDFLEEAQEGGGGVEEAWRVIR